MKREEAKRYIIRFNPAEVTLQQISAIKSDTCGQRPGLCEGTIVLTPRHWGKVILSIRPGMWIKRGDRLVLLDELRVGDEIHVQAFEMAGTGAAQPAP